MCGHRRMAALSVRAPLGSPAFAMREVELHMSITRFEAHSIHAKYCGLGENIDQKVKTFLNQND